MSRTRTGILDLTRRDVARDPLDLGRHDQLVPIAFMKHVEQALPAARHLELDCGHVPQLEAPEQTHRAIRESSPDPSR
jgi:pimeloyl-ACP methyl ester carboxylesterase